MNNTIKVSVIIPVYNVAPYLSECLSSLMHQTLTDVEFIVVNDGSTDGSDLIFESFAQKDSRFRVIHQSNQGVSVARNQGLQLAQGECVAFVDADDFVAADFLEKLYTAYSLYQVQIVTACFTSQVDGQWIAQKISIPTARVFIATEIHHDIIPYFLQGDTLNSSCVKLFSRAFIEHHKIAFPKGMTNGEDALFCLQAFAKAERIVFMDYSGYHYREVSGSASRNILAKNYLQQAIDTLDFDHQKYADLQLSPTRINHYKAHRYMEAIYNLIHIYLKPNATVSWRKRVNVVRQIVHHPKTKATVHYLSKDLETDASGYRKKMLQCIRARFLFGILALTFYSNYRNQYYK
ncbi:MAG: glycosyltransferase [Flavobacterium sp.]|uniref:glycosyltransferase family 2 protein n=1 Tax=Flavobacterium sp. TaxID=239 RepID=UPI0022C617B7|nr:glycosyltransferase [Flavobacterium sp.]MCZ8298005.1 glycosyltransferase [Flavobacterium sp.]